MSALWPFGLLGIPLPKVQKGSMEARLSPRRLLTCAAALVALVALTSGCGGGSYAPASAPRHAPTPVKYSSPVLSFTHPAAWKAYPFRWAGGLHFRPLVYLSTQPVHDPCSTQGNTISCGFPVGRLRPGGVLVTWNASSPPAMELGPGSQIRVGGHPARRVETASGICRSIDADRTIDVLIQTRPLPSPLTELTACLRRPGVAQAERSVDALLASTKFASH
jgi:hypothetical protein